MSNVLLSKNVKTIVVTGADGFVGFRLVNALRKLGHEVIEYTRKDGDITAISFPKKHIDHVYHLAALTSVPESWKNPKEYYRVNTLGTLNVLDNCVLSSCSMTFMSTYVYGQPLYNPIDENHPKNPNSPYALSKSIGEELCTFYHKVHKLPITVFRSFNIYGYGQSSTNLISTIFNQLLDVNLKEVKLLDLTPSRDYVYIDDVIQALVCSLREYEEMRVFNIASGESYTVQQVYDIVQDVVGIKKPVISAHVERKNEVSEIRGSIDLIREILGWKPNFNFYQGIQETLNAYLKVNNASILNEEAMV